MHDVKVERHQLATEVKFWIVVERPAAIFLEAVLHRPDEHVAERVEIKMQVERDCVIQAETFIVNLAIVDQATTEGDGLALMAPDEKPHAFRHHFCERAKVI